MTGCWLAPYGTPPPARLEYDRLVRQLRVARAPWHLTFDTPSTPTRQDPTVNYDAEHDFDDASNCPRCETGRFAPDAVAPPQDPTPTFQYGVRADGEVRWPDEDDELFFPSGAGGGFACYISASDLPALQAAAKLSCVTLVQRTLGPVEDVPAPLPTTPGSVVRATVRSGRTVFVHNDNSTNFPWTGRTPQYGKNDSWHPDALDDVEILFDAGAAS